MEKDAFDRFLRERYHSSLDHFRHRAIYNRRIYNWLQWSIIILSGLNALLIGLQTVFDSIQGKVTALVISVIISILAGAFKTFNFQEKWATYQKLIVNMENEYDLYTASSGIYSQNDNKESLFVTQVRAIITEGIINSPNLTIQQSSKSRKRLLRKLLESQNGETEQNKLSDL